MIGVGLGVALLVVLVAFVGLGSYLLGKRTATPTGQPTPDDARIHLEAAAIAKAVLEKAIADTKAVKEMSDAELLAKVNTHRPGGQ